MLDFGTSKDTPTTNTGGGGAGSGGGFSPSQTSTLESKNTYNNSHTMYGPVMSTGASEGFWGFVASQSGQSASLGGSNLPAWVLPVGIGVAVIALVFLVRR